MIVTKYSIIYDDEDYYYYCYYYYYCTVFRLQFVI
jgi:hypothetical protein